MLRDHHFVDGGHTMTRRNVHLFVFDSMADWEASFAIAGINNPQFQRESGRYRVVTAGLTTKPVTTMGGLHIQPDICLSEIDPDQSAMLILPGGDRWECGGNAGAIELARAFFIESIPVAAICAATLALARAGMLDDFHHTSNSREYLASSGYRGGSFYCDVPAIADEGVITASGIAPVEFAREIFRTLGLYSREALDAWYALFRLGDASRYSDLMECVSR
jgi:putative intracellular protease/amidase